MLVSTRENWNLHYDVCRGNASAHKGGRTEVIDTRKTGYTETEPAGFERTYDRFEERTAIQRFGHTVSPHGIAMDFVSNGLETYLKYDHYQDTHEMVNIYTEVQTTYAHYGSNGQWIGNTVSLDMIPPAHATPGPLINTDYIGPTAYPVGTTLD